MRNSLRKIESTSTSTQKSGKSNSNDRTTNKNDTNKNDPSKFLSDNLVRIYYRLINKNIQSPPPFDSNKSSLMTSVMSFFSKESKEIHMIKACLKNYRQRLLIDLQYTSRSKMSLQRVIDESTVVYDLQEQQLISWGLRENVHLFKLQTWSKMTRSRLMKEMVEFIHERIDLRAEKTGRYIKMYEGKTNPDTYTLIQCQEFCAAPEFIFNRDHKFMRQANKLLRLDLLCSSSGKKFKESQAKAELGPDERSTRKKVLRSILERYTSLPTIEELINIEEDLTWVQFCEWYSRRAEEKQEIEEEFADFVGDQREREGRLFFKWRSSLILPGSITLHRSPSFSSVSELPDASPAGTAYKEDTTSPAPSLGAMGMSPMSSSSNDSSFTAANNNSASTPFSTPKSQTVHSPSSAASSSSAAAASAKGDGSRRQSSGSSSFIGLKMTPASIKAFIKYFANDLIGVTYQIPRDCVTANWELTSTLFHKKAGLMRYSSVDQQKSDQYWRYHSQLCRYVHPSVYYVPDDYHGDEPCSINDVDSDDPDAEVTGEEQEPGYANDEGSWRKGRAKGGSEGESTADREAEGEEIEQKGQGGGKQEENVTEDARDVKVENIDASGINNVGLESLSGYHSTSDNSSDDMYSAGEVKEMEEKGVGVGEKARGGVKFHLETTLSQPQKKASAEDSTISTGGLISDDLILPDYCTPKTSVDHSSHSTSLLSLKDGQDSDKRTLFPFSESGSGSGSTDDYSFGGLNSSELNFDSIYNVKEGEGDRISPISSPKVKVTSFLSSPLSSPKSPSTRPLVPYTLSSRLQCLPVYRSGQFGKDYARASRMLSLVATSMTPQDILFNLSLAFKWLLRDAIDISGSRAVIGADLLVPLFTMVLINAQVPNIHMVLQHIKDYGQFEAHGDISYNVANLEGSLSFVMDYELPPKLRKQIERKEPWAAALSPSHNKPVNDCRAAVVSIEPFHDGSTIKEALVEERMDDSQAKDPPVGEGTGTLDDGEAQRSNDQLAMERLGAWLREQHTMEDTIDILQKEGWMI